MDFSAFEPEQIACMRAAYEDAMDLFKDADVRLSELVAKHIIEVARTGVRLVPIPDSCIAAKIYSITSLARVIGVGGTVRPSAFAV